MSAAVLHKIGEITGGVSVGRARHPKVFLVEDKRREFEGKCSPLPIVAIASSSRKFSMCKVLPQSLPQILNHPQSSKKKATTSRLKPQVNICDTQISVEGAVQVYGRGASLGGAAKKFTAIILRNACRYDYEFSDKYVRAGVHKASSKIIEKALENLGHNSNRILIGVARSLITADLDFFSSDEREIVSSISVDEQGTVEVSGKSSKLEIDSGGHGVVAVGYSAFIFERVRPRQGEKSPWNISKPFRVDSWDDELFHKALSYCAKRSSLTPRGLRNPVKKEFVLDRVVEGPARGLAMEEDRKDRNSRNSSSHKSAGAPLTLATPYTSPRLRARVPPVLLGAESLPAWTQPQQSQLIRQETSQDLAIPAEVEALSDEDSVSSGISLDYDTGNMGRLTKEPTYVEVLVGSTNDPRSVGTGSTVIA